MLSVFIIIFREVFEISLIVSIVLAATKELPGRNKAVGIGFISGIIISAIIAKFADKISDMADGAGQDLLIALLLAIAVVMVGYTVIWMAKHSKDLASKIKKTTEEVAMQKASIYALSTIIATALIRELTEIMLFTYGVVVSTSLSGAAVIYGVISGLFVGILVGVLFYQGLLKFQSKYIFKVTSFLLILLAAGMASKIPNFLASAGYLTEYSSPLWDSSKLLSERSIAGTILSNVVGYTDKPSLMQLVFFIVTFGALFGASRIKRV